MVIIEITGGEQEPLEVVKKNAEKLCLKHPVLWDKDCRNHRQYGLKKWPVAYLIGTDGKVFWEGNPARVVNRPEHLREFRKLIEAELKKSHSTFRSGSGTTGPIGATGYEAAGRLTMERPPWLWLATALAGLVMLCGATPCVLYCVRRWRYKKNPWWRQQT